MLVYGDRTRTITAQALLAEVEADLAAGDAVSALIALGQLLQCVADAEFEQRGHDARSPAINAITATLMHVSSSPSGEGDPAKQGGGGRKATGSGASPLSQAGCAGLPAPPWGSSLLDHLRPLLPNGELRARIPEGYAFYALHPALHAAAAGQLPPGDWQVIGIRSIGASLAPVVAAALGAPPPVTVRPIGHPFARELRLAPELEAEWAAHPGPFAVVDEGPGLSGSSFGAAADALERLGVPRPRIAFLPGHDGDLGPQASPEHRARWAAALRPVANFDDAVLPALLGEVEALVGPATAPLQDISGGGWRDLRGWSEPPPTAPAQERRKFLHRTAEGPWLVKFAGIGRIGRAKLDRARALHAAGWTPEPAGLVHGFLVERWIAGARPARPSPEQLADHLAFRARALPAEPGASLAELREMLQVNAEEALGPAAAAAVARLPDPTRLQARVKPVHVDARLHAWEWLAAPDGRLVKTDALDHSEAHDLVGPQDIAWDVAGAEAEFDLAPGQVERIRARVGAGPELLAFMRPAYLAFQLGLWTMAADAQGGGPGEDRARAQARGYARRLARLLNVDPPAPPG